MAFSSNHAHSPPFSSSWNGQANEQEREDSREYAIFSMAFIPSLALLLFFSHVGERRCSS